MTDDQKHLPSDPFNGLYCGSCGSGIVDGQCDCTKMQRPMTREALMADGVKPRDPPHETHLVGWEHISSAPRDGSEVLVWNGKNRHVAHYDKIESEWVSSYRTTTKRLPVAPKPTLWHPLPAQPVTAEGQL